MRSGEVQTFYSPLARPHLGYPIQTRQTSLTAFNWGPLSAVAMASRMEKQMKKRIFGTRGGGLERINVEKVVSVGGVGLERNCGGGVAERGFYTPQVGSGSNHQLVWFIRQKTWPVSNDGLCQGFLPRDMSMSPITEPTVRSELFGSSFGFAVSNKSRPPSTGAEAVDQRQPQTRISRRSGTLAYPKSLVTFLSTPTKFKSIGYHVSWYFDVRASAFVRIPVHYVSDLTPRLA